MTAVLPCVKSVIMSSESSLLAVVNSVGSLLGPWPARKIIDGEVSSDACAILDAYSTYGHPAVSLLAAVVAGHRRGTPSVIVANSKP